MPLIVQNGSKFASGRTADRKHRLMVSVNRRLPRPATKLDGFIPRVPHRRQGISGRIQKGPKVRHLLSKLSDAKLRLGIDWAPERIKAGIDGISLLR